MNAHLIAAEINRRWDELNREGGLNRMVTLEAIVSGFDKSPEPTSETWPHVLAFARLMEAKLEKNRHKGNREGWLKDHPWDLVERMLDETVEVQQCFTEGSDGRIEFEDVESLSKECADVANFAMMIADCAANQ